MLTERSGVQESDGVEERGMPERHASLDAAEERCTTADADMRG